MFCFTNKELHPVYKVVGLSLIVFMECVAFPSKYEEVNQIN